MLRANDTLAALDLTEYFVAVHDNFSRNGPRPVDEEIPATDSRHRGRRGSGAEAPEIGLARNAKKVPATLVAAGTFYFGYEQVLLQVGDFIMSCPVLLLGFAILLM